MNRTLNIRKSVVSLALALILTISGAANVFAFSDIGTDSDTSEMARNVNLNIPCNDGGKISHEALQYTITVNESATYTFTMASTTQSGDLLVIFERAGGSTRYINQNINGSYQQRFYLPAGTYYLLLANGSGVSTFSWSIHKTFWV